jgi:hypothetical protein
MKYSASLGEIGTKGKTLLEQVDLFTDAGFTTPILLNYTTYSVK